jgi:hypothetical protein
MFGGNKGIFVSRKGIQKVVFVLAFWLVSLSILYLLSRDYSGRSAIDPAVEKALASVSTSKNELGRCRFGLYDPQSKRPLGSVAFETLKTDSADLGLFKTAACRAMSIRNLKIDIIGNPFSFIQDSKSIRPNNASSTDTIRDWKKSFLETVSLQTFDKDDTLRMPWPDFSHLVQMRVSGFQCCFIDGQNVPLNIQSKKASVEPDKSAEIILRGCVILQTPQATLETNCARWDIQNQTFSVQGLYIIHSANGVEKGQNGYFDPALNKITFQKTFANKGEKTK